jgi:hypothetical protein
MLQNFGAVTSVVASLAVVATAVAAGLLWIFRRGQASGKAQAEREAQQRAQAESEGERRAMRNRLAEVENELATMRARIARREVPLPRGQDHAHQGRRSPDVSPGTLSAKKHRKDDVG